MFASGVSCICILLITGCGGHDTASLKTALLGHWIAESGHLQYYFTSTSLVIINGSCRMDQTYTIQEYDESGNWIKLKIKMGWGREHVKMLEFSPDRKLFTETVILWEGDAGTSRHWDYAGSKSSP